MAEFEIADKTGEWIVSIAPLGMRNPFTQVRFPFNTPVKVKVSAWELGQLEAGNLKKAPDPLAVDPVPVPQAKAKP